MNSFYDLKEKIHIFEEKITNTLNQFNSKESTNFTFKRSFYSFHFVDEKSNTFIDLRFEYRFKSNKVFVNVTKSDFCAFSTNLLPTIFEDFINFLNEINFDCLVHFNNTILTSKIKEYMNTNRYVYITYSGTKSQKLYYMLGFLLNFKDPDFPSLKFESYDYNNDFEFIKFYGNIAGGNFATIKLDPKDADGCLDFSLLPSFLRTSDLSENHFNDYLFKKCYSLDDLKEILSILKENLESSVTLSEELFVDILKISKVNYDKEVVNGFLCLENKETDFNIRLLTQPNFSVTNQCDFFAFNNYFREYYYTNTKEEALQLNFKMFNFATKINDLFLKLKEKVLSFEMYNIEISNNKINDDRYFLESRIFDKFLNIKAYINQDNKDINFRVIYTIGEFKEEILINDVLDNQNIVEDTFKKINEEIDTFVNSNRILSLLNPKKA